MDVEKLIKERGDLLQENISMKRRIKDLEKDLFDKTSEIGDLSLQIICLKANVGQDRTV